MGVAFGRHPQPPVTEAPALASAPARAGGVRLALAVGGLLLSVGRLLAARAAKRRSSARGFRGLAVRRATAVGSGPANAATYDRAVAFQTGKSEATSHIPEFRPQVSLDAAAAIDLRVGDVTAASEVEVEVEIEHKGVMRKRRKRFLKLHLDLGAEERVIVTDLLRTLDAESAVGTSLIIVANVPPETVAGHASHGRVLLGENYDPAPMPSTFRRQLPEPAQLPAGAAIAMI